MPQKEFYGDVGMNGNKIKGLSAGSEDGDGVRFDEMHHVIRNLDDSDGLYAGFLFIEKKATFDPTELSSWLAGTGTTSGFTINSVDTNYIELRYSGDHSPSFLYLAIGGTVVQEGSGFVSLQIKQGSTPANIFIYFVDASGTKLNLSALSTTNRIRFNVVYMNKAA